VVAELHADRCEVSVRRGMFSTKRSPLTANAAGAASLATALASLLAQADAGVPRRACLTVPDEHVYYALLPASAAWPKRYELAARHFAETLGRQNLRVGLSLVDNGKSWLAAAIEDADLAQWKQTFAESGFELRSVRPALLHDLDRIAPDVPDDSALAIVRSEGAMLVSIAQGTLVDLRWERGHAIDLEQRIVAFSRSAGTQGKELPVVVYSDDEVVSESVARFAAGHGWKSLRFAKDSAEVAA